MADAAVATQATESEATESDESVAADIFPGAFSAPEEPATAEPEKPTDADESTETLAAPAKSKAVDLVADDKLFDDKALANKGGLLAARKAILDARSEVRSMQAKANDVFVRTQRREQQSKEKFANGKRYEAAAKAIHDEKIAQVDALFNGNAEQIIDALGRLTKRDGLKVYNEMTDAILANGKKRREQPQKDPEVDELKKEMAALREQLGQEKMSTARSGWLQNAVLPAIKNTELYPGLAHQVEAGLGQDLVEYIEQEKLSYFEEHGRPIHDNELFKQIDAKLRKFIPPEKSKQPAADPPAAKKPAAAAPKRLPGSGPSPANAGTSSGASRDLSEDERLAEIAKDSAFVNRLFGFG